VPLLRIEKGLTGLWPIGKGEWHRPQRMRAAASQATFQETFQETFQAMTRAMLTEQAVGTRGTRARKCLPPLIVTHSSPHAGWA
jgi:hypothetical protein